LQQEPMIDPYIILGIAKSATQDQIKQAYRKRSKECHPDVSEGREEEFKQLARAYDILGNAATRDEYDRTGGVASKDNMTEACKLLLFETFTSVFMRYSDRLTSMPMITTMQDAIRKKQMMIVAKKSKADVRLALLEQVQMRLVFLKDGEKPDVLGLFIENQLETIRAHLKTFVEQDKVCDNTIEMLKDYKFDAIFEAKHHWFMGNQDAVSPTARFFLRMGKPEVEFGTEQTENNNYSRKVKPNLQFTADDVITVEDLENLENLDIPDDIVV